MTLEEARAALESANRAIATAAVLLRLERPTMERLLDEDRRADAFLPITDPTLWRSTERQAVADALVPLYSAAVTFLDIYNSSWAAIVEAAGRDVARETAPAGETPR
jgi:hypothetical protein